MCEQLDSIEEYYDIEKMTTEALESIIEYLVENQVKEIEEKNIKMKQISYQNQELIKKGEKLKNLYEEALEKMKHYNNKIDKKEKRITELESSRTQDLERFKEKVEQKETKIKLVNQIIKKNKE